MIIFLIKIIFGLFFSLFIFHTSIAFVFIEQISNPFLVYDFLTEVPNPKEWDNIILGGAGLSIMCFVVFIFMKQGKPNQYGFSKYGKKEDRKKALLDKNKGITLGSLVVPNPKDFLNTNLYKATGLDLSTNEPLSIGVLAPPGTGKTTAVIIPTLLRSENSFIVNDPKGELFQKTGPYRSTFSKILRFDPMQVYGKGVVFNPFSRNMLPKTENEYFNYVNQIANILIVEGEKGGDAYFINNARQVFIFVACFLIKKHKGTSLPEIAGKILEDSNVVETFSDMVEEMQDLEEKTSFSNAIIKQGNGALSSASAPEAWGSIISTLNPLIQSYTTDDLIKQATEGENEVDLKQFKEFSNTLYIIVPDSARKVLYPIIRILLELCSTKLITIDEESTAENKSNTRVTFLIDEFPRLGKLKEILELPAISRGMGVNVVFVAQAIQQIESAYSKEEAKGMFSLLSYWYVFKQGDMDTAEMFSKAIGKHTVKKVSRSYDTKSMILEKGSSRSVSFEGLPLVTPNEITSTDPQYGWLIASFDPSRPYRVAHNYWFKDKELKKREKDHRHLIDLI